MTGAGFPHSEILESQPGCRLLEAYRRLQRPSSAPGTKTSTVCPYKLDTRHYMQKSAQNTEDARVHYAVLKIRTEPCDETPQPGGLVRRPFESAPWKSGCFLRTQQCAHPARRSIRPFGITAKAVHLLAALSRAR
jgi:hypothetical protein